MTRPTRVWIVDILMSDDVEHKLWVKHRVRRAEVEEAALMGGYRDAIWLNDPDYGERLLVRGPTFDGVELLVVLEPVNEADGIWRCRTARRAENR